MTNRIGVLGGTFDPVHNGHLGLAREALETFELDRLLLIPVSLSPHKQNQFVTSNAHRLEMLRLASDSDPSFEVSEVEIRRGGISYTIDTLDNLRALYPESEIYLILGADAFDEIDTWKHSVRLLEQYNILIGTRPGYGGQAPEDSLKNILGDSVPYLSSQHKERGTTFTHARSGRLLIFFDITPRNISSRDIRKKIFEKKTTKNLLLPEVEQYIMRHQLYQAKPQPDMG